jgi:hypothetical protein
MFMGQFNGKSRSDLGEFQHVIEREFINGVIRSVDEMIGIFKRTFNSEC